MILSVDCSGDRPLSPSERKEAAEWLRALAEDIEADRPSRRGTAIKLGLAQIFSPRWSEDWRDDCEFEELRIEDIRRSRGELVDEPDEVEVDEESEE